MAIDYQAISEAGGIAKGPSLYQTKAERHKATLLQRQRVFALATVRDGSCCRVCGQWRNPRAVSMLNKLHHHHVIYLSQGGPDETWNVLCLCSAHHDEEHAGKLTLSGNADQRDPVTGRLCGVKVERPSADGGVLEIVAWV